MHYKIPNNPQKWHFGPCFCHVGAKTLSKCSLLFCFQAALKHPQTYQTTTNIKAEERQIRPEISKFTRVNNYLFSYGYITIHEIISVKIKIVRHLVSLLVRRGPLLQSIMCLPDSILTKCACQAPLCFVPFIRPWEPYCTLVFVFTSP